MQCTNQALRQGLLAGSPLNIAMVGIWVLVYLFMPAAILGSVMGVLGTVVLAAVAAAVRGVYIRWNPIGFLCTADPAGAGGGATGAWHPGRDPIWIEG